MYLTLFCFYVVLHVCVILLYSVTVTVFLLFMIPLLLPHVTLIAIQHSRVTMKPSLPNILIFLILLCDVAWSQVTSSNVYTGQEIVDILAGTWKNAGDFGAAENQQVKESEESRRRLENWRRLDSCSFTKGVDFNVVSASCSVDSEIAVNSGEELRIKGLAGVDHPELQRGGTARSPWVFRHFVLNGESKLTMINMKLSGAWVGSVSDVHATNTCGHCLKTDCYTNCCGGSASVCSNTRRSNCYKKVLSYHFYH